MNRLPILLSLPLALLSPLQAQEEDKGTAAHFDRVWREMGKPRTPLDDLPTVHLSIIYGPNYCGYKRIQIEIVNSTKEELHFSGFGRWPLRSIEMRRQGRWEYDEELNVLDCGTGIGDHAFAAGESLVYHYNMDDLRHGPDRRFVAAFFSEDGRKASFLPLIELPLPDEFVMRWSREIIHPPEDPEKYVIWEQHMLAAVAFQKERAPEEAIPALVSWIAQLASKSNGEKTAAVLHAAREALLAIPGHMAWIGKEIARISDGCTTGKGGFRYDAAKTYFEILERFPTPETVKVLGELLMSGGESREGYYWNDTSGRAIETLERLGIFNPLAVADESSLRNAEAKLAAWLHPAEWEEARRLKGKAMEEAWQHRLGAWRLWYRQVRAGTRTFTFAGDETVYSLSGPVDTALDPGRNDAGASPPLPQGTPAPPDP